ncbi:eukaryotic translation initiation factor 4E-1-like, partial [Primulina huaijiensis]|uniref:eukaryotic translation initiation factor 4E-1-like n=1 Tax=Primulina huaijiensis TaxID=1492673 RepID=UPI003CC78279
QVVELLLSLHVLSRVYGINLLCLACSVYNNIHHPSKLVVGADFRCFKNIIEPKWEDPVCASGGKWTASFYSVKSDTWLYPKHIYRIPHNIVTWRLQMKSLLKCTKAHNRIPHNISLHERRWSITLFIVCAFLVRFNPLLVSEIFQLSIGKQWKEFLDYNDSIGFIFHEEAKRLDRGSKNRYTV